jgi:hypothetical protein
VNSRCIALAAASLALAVPLTADAGAKVKIDEQTNIELGLRLQTQLFSTEANLDPVDPEFETQNSFLVRRARLKFRGNYSSWLTVYVQSDYEEQAGTSSDMRIIDAYVLLKPHPLAWVYVGQNMAPALRANVTSSGAFLTLDRPAITYRSLTWGARGKYAFTNTTFGDSNSRLLSQGRANVRDLGVTLFGNHSFTESAHFKYYLGVYDGAQAANEDNLRFTGRAQVNLLGKESGYYNDATYLGEKKTVGIGATYDTQNAVALDQATSKKVDYKLWSVDLFTEMPLPVGSLSAEVGYADLDLGGGATLATAGGTALGNASQSQGSGFYGQVGYFVKNVQPWVQYEEWKSDAAQDLGSFKAYRAGVNYYLKGADVKVVAGFERFEPEVPLSGGAQDTVQSFILGLYVDL